jgi:hypothetical protein
VAKIPDEAWAEVARASRDALQLLGRGITPRCLPDEPSPCGGSFAMHACAHLAALKAVADHELEHLGTAMTVISGEIYRHELEDLQEGCGSHA